MTDEQTPAPETEPQDTIDPLASLRQGLGELTSAVTGLSVQCGREHDRATVREKIIDRLHEENERLRAGDRQIVLRPLLTDMQRMRHELLRESARLPEQMSGPQVAAVLRSFAYSLELSLQRGGVDVIAPAIGSAVDPVRHRVTATLATTDQTLDATVAEVIMDGYFDTAAERTTTPAQVQAHRWAAAAGEQHEENTDGE